MMTTSPDVLRLTDTLTYEDTGDYVCKVTNGIRGTQAAKLRLVPQTAAVFQPPSDDFMLAVGMTGTLSVSFYTHSETPDVKVDWRKSGESTALTNHREEAGPVSLTIRSQSVIIQGTVSKLTLTDVSLDNGGNYTVTVTNVINSVTESRNVLIFVNVTAEYVTTESQSTTQHTSVVARITGARIDEASGGTVTVTEGVPKTLTCTVTGDSNPAPSYRWRVDGAPVSGLGRTFSLTADRSIRSVTCTATNTYSNGTELSRKDDTVTLNVQYLDTPSAITPVVAIEGLDISLTCSAEGNPQPGYQWMRPGRPEVINTSGDYPMKRVERSAAGEYTCTVSNTVGERQAVVTLVVQCDDEGQGSAAPVGGIAGGVGGAVVLALTVVVVVIVFILRRRTDQGKTDRKAGKNAISLHHVDAGGNHAASPEEQVYQKVSFEPEYANSGMDRPYATMQNNTDSLQPQRSPTAEDDSSVPYYATIPTSTVDGPRSPLYENPA